MSAHAALRLAHGKSPRLPRPSMGTRLGALRSRLKAWIEVCADYHRAANLHEGLRRLSDAELNRRGLSRATLAWDIAQACDRASGRSHPIASTVNEREAPT